MAASLVEGLLQFYIFIAAGFVIGYLLERRHMREKASKIFTKLVLYVLSPIAIFISLVNVDISLSFEMVLSIMLTQITTAFLMMTICYFSLRKKNLPKEKLGGYILISGFPNATIFPLPIIISSFGEAFIIIPVLFSTPALLLRGTLGTYISIKMGDNDAEHVSLKSTLKKMILFPPTLAILVSVVFLLFPQIDWSSLDGVKSLISPAISIFGALTIGLIIAGLKKESIGQFKHDIPRTMVFRFLLPPIFFLLFSVLLIFPENASIIKSILLLEVSGPPAIMNAMFAVNFNLDKDFVASMVVVLTLFMILLAPIILLLGTVLF